jgi:hypothetical protein
MNDMSKLPKSRQDNLVVQEFESEQLVYDLEIDKAFCLNETSALVFQLCNGKNSVGEIARLMAQTLRHPVSEEMVWLALDGLKKEKLLEKADVFEIDFDGLTRRQVIKKVGLASMVLLPVIASVIAPPSTFAASGTNCPPLGTCIPAGMAICPAGCLLRVNCDLRQANSNCGGPPYAPQPAAVANCATFPGFTFAPADCLVNLNPG